MSNALLSRVAESIFWVGRYVERAEGTARILDVVVYQALEQSGAEADAAAERLLAVMGQPPDGDEAILWQVTERLARDPESRSSIAGALNAARENTRAVRHVIPVELWEKINGTWSDLPHQWELARRVGPASYLAFVKTQTAAITGLADTTMSRDQTWLFFTLGRCLERTDVVARQLASLSFQDIPDSGLVMLLRACGGYEPYLRLAQGVVDPERVLDFLLRDRLFPRSAFASLTVAEECLAQISPERADEWDEARGLIGLARAELEYSPPSSLSTGLARRLDGLQRTISQVSDAVTRRYFAHDLPTQWRRGAGS
ncbi:MAG: alpha-E domain-containing protein [Acidimicrobiales bacterium]